MHHVADPRHVAKRARVEFAVQSRGVLVGLDNAIIRAGNQANRNIQLPVELADGGGPNSLQSHASNTRDHVVLEAVPVVLQSRRFDGN